MWGQGWGTEKHDKLFTVHLVVPTSASVGTASPWQQKCFFSDWILLLHGNQLSVETSCHGNRKSGGTWISSSVETEFQRRKRFVHGRILYLQGWRIAEDICAEGNRLTPCVEHNIKNETLNETSNETSLWQEVGWACCVDTLVSMLSASKKKNFFKANIAGTTFIENILYWRRVLFVYNIESS